MTVAKVDLDMYTDLYDKMTRMCSKKCIVKYSDGDLQVGEMTCIDRCVGKYMHAHDLVGVELKKFEEGLQAQEEIRRSFQQSS